MLTTFHASSQIVANISESILLSIAIYVLLGGGGGVCGRVEHYQKITLPLGLFFKILPFQIEFIIFCSIAIFSPVFLRVVLLLKCVALLQSE